MSENLLDSFLSIASKNLNQNTSVTPKRQLKDADLFNQDSNINHIAESDSVPKTKSFSNVHSGDTDSSDDEDNKYHEDRKYNDSGKDVKHLLKTATPTASSSSRQSTITWKTKITEKQIGFQQQTSTKPQDVYSDPVFGLRIVNPVVSFTTLQERMVGREAVMFSRIKTFLTRNISEKNWVIAGVVVSKSSVRTSQKGNQFLIWTLSDLKDDIKLVSVFLFGNAYKELWKTASGTVVGILNPNVLEKKDNSKDEAALSVDNAQKVMILGQSKDYGTCKSVKKNGEKCNAIVNINRCEYCIYHIKQEYQKCSRRSELQSNFAGRGLTALRNKVLGKNEVFYAGKIYTAIPAKRNRKLEEKDESLLQALNGGNIRKSEVTKNKPKIRQKSAANIEVTQRQRLKDLTLLERLGENRVQGTFNASHSAEATLETSKKLVSDVLSKLKDNTSNKTSADPDFPKNDSVSSKNGDKVVSKPTSINIPLLSKGEKNMVDLDTKVTPKQMNKAKLNALKYIQKNGPLKKSDPNCSKKLVENRKRIMENSNDHEHLPKKQKITENEFLSDRFKKMMAATSKHSDLLNERDNEEQEKYFHKLEVKEQMEEKMIHTYKVPCKAVKCLQCKYTNFSASQFCKDNKHPLKVFDAVKRFFKCGDCGNRTVSLEVVPTVACKNCGSGKWERTGMVKEKCVEIGHTLSIRGGEQKFVNSIISDSNLNLLMPDE
ncbi:hypothetical protein Zmor_005925 [Zophobas morio]|uniref:Protein MCM10 homolog n=1 Tax=Zophobas morio TaxID=2755281 RepID=A0AA38IQN0_9CUCU|nr:hypothetical protein Zmor_005925 [Zophobas morio]